MHYRGSQKEKKERKMAENIYQEIIAENFSTWKGRWTARPRKHRESNKMKTKRSTPRHIVIKMTKIKDKKKILKVAR